MHRHGYKGRKLQLDAGPRRALLRGQMTSLVLNEAIVTTVAKAKEVAPRFERLVTYAKKNTLASGRAIREELLTEPAAQKLIQEIAPIFAERQGGYTRIIKMGNRRGDNAPMAHLSLVMDDRAEAEAKAVVAEKAAAKAEKSAAKATKAEKVEVEKGEAK